MNQVDKTQHPLATWHRVSAALALVVALLLPFGTAPVFAEDAADDNGRIAVISLRSAILKTERAMAALKELEKQDAFKQNFEQYKALGDEYRALVEAYQKDRAVMSAEKREAEQRKILDKERDAEYIAQKLQQARQEWEERELDAQASSVRTVVKNLVEERNIGVLINADTGVLVYADDSYDISDEVTERLNRIAE